MVRFIKILYNNPVKGVSKMKWIKSLLAVVIICYLILGCGEQKPSEGYDIVILNGRVMDPETNFDGIRNVGIMGDRIAIITEKKIKGFKTIDAKGLAVVPGFINTHSHSFSLFDQKIMAHDGATTILDTEGGAANIKTFYKKYDGNSFLNYGLGVSHEQVRRVVMDGTDENLSSDPTFAYESRAAAQEDGHAQWALDVPTKEQLNQILTYFEQGMRDGGITVNSTVGYMAYGVPTNEMFLLQKISKKYNRFFGCHTRFGPTESLPLHYSLGTREVIANAVVLDAPLLLSHINNQGWDEIYEMTRRLQEQGKAIFAEYYPSITGNPNVAAPGLMPDKIKGNNIEPTKHIYNVSTGELYESDELFFKEQKETPSKSAFLILRDPEWMAQWVHMKDIAIACDAIAYLDEDGKPFPIETPFSTYGGHPRNSGTYGIVFSLAREQGIPLMDIVNNVSYIPAKYFSMVGLKSMQERGRMQEGMIADITMFDPETIDETSAMKEGLYGSYTKGIPHVMVSGRLVVENGETNTGIRPGKPIRYDVITEGEIILEYNDKQYQWHADLADPKDIVQSQDMPKKSQE